MIAEKRPTWDDSKSYEGTWWPKGSRTSEFRGTLKFENRRPMLTITSPLGGRLVSDLAHSSVLHGELQSGKKATLWDAADGPLQLVGSDDDSIIHARRFTHALLGQHLGGLAEERFRYSAYGLYGLGVWSSMDTPIPRGLANESLQQYEPAYLRSFERDEFGVEYSAKVYLENPRRLEFDNDFPRGAVMKYTGDDARIVFECSPPAPARIHDLLLFDLQALLTFSYQGGAPLQAEWLASEQLDQAVSVMRRDSFTGHQPARTAFRHSMVLHTGIVEPSILLPAWWDAVDRLYPATQVIALYHHGSRGILESSVSSVIAVAEHLHSIIGPTRTRFPAGFLESKREGLKVAFPSHEDAPFREFLYQALKNNRPTLGTRLTELASAVTEPRLDLMAIDGHQWKNDIKIVRDLLAHTSSHVTRRGGDSSALLHRVNSETRAIVTILILKEMGFAATVLDESATTLAAHVRRFAK